MNTQRSKVAESCLLGAESNSMTFPQIVRKQKHKATQLDQASNRLLIKGAITRSK